MQKLKHAVGVERKALKRIQTNASKLGSKYVLAVELAPKTLSSAEPVQQLGYVSWSTVRQCDSQCCRLGDRRTYQLPVQSYDFAI